MSIANISKQKEIWAWQFASGYIGNLYESEKEAAEDMADIAEGKPIRLFTGCEIVELKSRSKLSVWYGSMPETNGKDNWTAILYRKSEEWLGGIASGITIDRSEYPDRVRYEADRMRYLIGEIEKEPFILDYDSDKRSDYVYPEDPEIVELKAALTLIMRAAEGAKVDCGCDPESPDAIRNAALASIAAVAAQGLGLLKGPKLSEGV